MIVPLFAKLCYLLVDLLMKLPKYPIPESILPYAAVASLVYVFVGACLLWHMPNNHSTLALTYIWLSMVIVTAPIYWAWFDTLDLKQLCLALSIMAGTLTGGPGAILANVAVFGGSGVVVGMVAIAPARRNENDTHDQADERATVSRFLELLFDTQEGYLQLRFCAGDPAKDKLKSGGWYHWPNEREDITTRAAALAAQHGDVYVSRASFAERKLSAAAAQPTRVLFVDDAPDDPPVPYSAVIRTGAGRPQAWYILDRHVPGDAAERIQRRITHKLNADRSGADITQIVRLPIGYNTKRAYGQPVPVTWESCTGVVYTPHEIAAAYPELPDDQAATDATHAGVDQALVDYWRGNLHMLTDMSGMPRRARNKNAPGYQYASGKYALDISDPHRRDVVPLDSAGHADTSRMRYSVGVWLFQLGYPDEEWWVLMEHLADFGASERKGTRWLQDDLARLVCICKRSVRTLRQTPTRIDSTTRRPPARLTVVERLRKGRPAALTSERYLAVMLPNTSGIGAGGGRVALFSVDEVAALHGVSRSSVERIERELRQSGALTRHMSRCRRYSYVEIFGPVKNDSVAAETAPNPGAVGGIFEGTESGNTQPNSDATHAHAHVGVHTPPQGLPACPQVCDAAELAEPASAAPQAEPAELAELAEPASAAPQAEPAELAELAEPASAAPQAEPASAAVAAPAGAVPAGGCVLPDTRAGASYTPSARAGAGVESPFQAKFRERNRRRERLRGMSLRELEREQAVLQATARKSRYERQRLALEHQAGEVEREIGRRRDRGIQAMTAGSAGAESVPAPAELPELPELPAGWRWGWVPSRGMHQAYCATDRDVRTGIYHTSELHCLLAEVYRLEQGRHAVAGAA
jgi:hypothetical protein